MSPPTLTLVDLAEVLEANPYEELDVFADDVAEIRALHDGKDPDSLQPLGPDASKLSFEREGRRYVVDLLEQGVVRVSRGDGETQQWTVDPRQNQKEMLRTLVRAAISAAISKKGGGWSAGLILGLLVGSVIGTAAPAQSRPRRVLTLRFDPSSRRWLAYDGGLVGWMKEELRPTG